MTHRRRLALLAVTVVAIGTAVATGGAVTPALADPVAGAATAPPDPSGTVVVPHGDVRVPNPYDRIEGATPQGVVYDREPGPLLLVPPSGAPVTLGTDRYLIGTARSFVVFAKKYGRPDTGWYDAASGARGTAPDEWIATAPDGGLLARAVTGATTEIVAQDTHGATRSLGVVPFAQESVRDAITSGEDGAVVTGPRAVSYVPYDGGGVRTYDLSAVPGRTSAPDCGPPAAGAFACAVGRSVVVAATTGSLEVTVVAGEENQPEHPGVTATSAVWLARAPSGGAFRSVVRSAPLTGGPVSTAPGVVAGLGPQLGFDGTRVIYRPITTTARPVFVAGEDAAAPPQVYAPVPLPPYRARLPRLGPGDQLAYTDNTRGDAHASVRTVQPVAGGVRPLAPRVVLPNLPEQPNVYGDAEPLDLDISGTTLGFLSGYFDHSETVSSPLLPTYRVGPGVGDATLSGHRALTTIGKRLQLADLVTGTSTTVVPNVSREDDFAFAGDRVLFEATPGQVRSRDLETGSETVVFTTRYKIQVIRAWGDHAVIGFGAVGDPTVVVVDLRTGATSAPSSTAHGVGAAGPAGYVRLDSGGVSTLVGWDGDRTVPVSGTELTASADVLAWLGSDGQLRVAPLPWSVTNPPRSYGDPRAPTTVAAGANWTFDLPTSAGLSSCAVVIAGTDAVVRTLPCAAAFAVAGEAEVTWDTRDAAGAPVPPGQYTWTVVASNPDGPLQRPDGSPGPVAGTVEVTS